MFSRYWKDNCYSGENVISHKIKDCSNKNYKYDYMKPYMVSCVISAFTCISCQSARTENA